ncbi:MAG: Stp1/IreP family PP2C-type Ser/Thr phosphatase [Nitrospirae bacterium]|nr:Stp1/IreP family PP2C-type Ser/Thr phosphatase [Nitrospirota bacterium]
MIIESFGLSDIGKKRKINEDSFGLFQDTGLFVVADGMGGHAGGEIASKLAVESVSEFIAFSNGKEDITWPFEIDEARSKDENRLEVAIRLANSRILKEGLRDRRLYGMGTTIVAALFAEPYLYIGHVGDSRAYLIRDGAIRQITEDHSLVYEQVKHGLLSIEEAKNHSMKNVLTKALGTESDLRVEIIAVKAEAGDAYLLCTDGLTNMVTDEESLRIVKGNINDMGAVSRELVDTANRNGGIDNITVILLKIK